MKGPVLKLPHASRRGSAADLAICPHCGRVFVPMAGGACPHCGFPLTAVLERKPAIPKAGESPKVPAA